MPQRNRSKEYEHAERTEDVVLPKDKAEDATTSGTKKARYRKELRNADQAKTRLLEESANESDGGL